MATLALRQAAIDDLSDIYHYTVRTWSSMQADAYYHRIQVACKNLASGVLVGKSFADITPHLLGYRVGKHIIFYTLDAHTMQVIRILHERMDYKNRL